MKTTVTATVRKTCPFREEKDTGTVTFVFDGTAPELHHLASVLAAYPLIRISHEDFTQRMADETGAKVTSYWETAGLRVTVEAG